MPAVPDPSTSPPLIEQVADAFRAAGWAFRPVDGRPVVESEFEAHHTKVALHVQAFDELGALSVVARLSFPVALASLAAANEAMMRTNLGLSVGNFEADQSSGEAFFRATNVFPGGRADPSTIASLVRTAVVEVDRITPFLAELNRDPAQSVPALLAREDLLPDIAEG